MLDRTQLFIDGSIHFLLMVVIIGQATVNLSQREVRVLALDLIGIPVVCQTIQGDLENFRLRPNQPNLTIGAFLDVGVVGRSRHRFQLPWTTRTSPMDIILRTQPPGHGSNRQGTRLSAQPWAGLIALVNQGRAGAGGPTLSSSTPTDAQQALYILPQTDYNVISSGNNGYSATSGYNVVTGLGTPAANLLLCRMRP
jgi:hypothetical protein